MHNARRLYERLGFVHDPDHDFHPPGGELVEGYRLRLDDPAPHPES
jgi:RimJ/RimL family protein N-acetyltransferase